MAVIRTAVFMLVFYGLTVPYVAAALIGAAIGPRPMHAVIHSWVRLLDWCSRHILGIRMRIEGEIPEGQFLFAAKHQAMYETMELLNMLDTPAPVLKKELTDIFAWGWLAKQYGGIPVDRSGGAKTMRAMLKRTREVL
ncbi:MAG: 1-acyl-sn-glycerol-3-phosphate acyltransferase, partial [Parasphingopyxis sp.]